MAIVPIAPELLPRSIVSDDAVHDTGASVVGMVEVDVEVGPEPPELAGTWVVVVVVLEVDVGEVGGAAALCDDPHALSVTPSDSNSAAVNFRCARIERRLPAIAIAIAISSGSVWPSGRRSRWHRQ
jgi:hypothetical protein